VNEEAQVYFQAIEEHFIEKRGQALLLSPEDVRRVAEWHGEGVPIEAVKEGIDLHFERMARRGKEPRRAVTLAYCEDDVLGAWAGVKQRKLGARDGAALEADAIGGTEEHARLLAKLRASQEKAQAAGADGDATAIAKAIGKLEKKAELFDPNQPAHDAQRTEDHLRRIEQALDKAMRQAAGDESLAALAAGVERELADKRARMKPETYERVSDQLLAKRLRERFDLPRLSLFYT
jgi:hypothetical protein